MAYFEGSQLCDKDIQAGVWRRGPGGEELRTSANCQQGDEATCQKPSQGASWGMDPPGPGESAGGNGLSGWLDCHDLEKP